MPPDPYLVVRIVLSTGRIAPEAVTVLRTLLDRCANRTRLAESILNNVVQNAARIAQERDVLISPFALKEFLYFQVLAGRVLVHPLPPVEACLAEAIDDEAFGWLRGFLVYRKLGVNGLCGKSRSIFSFFPQQLEDGGRNCYAGDVTRDDYTRRMSCTPKYAP